MPELITIKAVEAKTTAAGQQFRRVQDQRGRWLSVWNSDIPAAPGQSLLAEISSQEKNGQTWWRINSATVAEPATTASSAAAAPSGDRDTKIARQVALYASVYLAQHDEQMRRDPINVLATAEQFYRWLQGEEADTPF